MKKKKIKKKKNNIKNNINKKRLKINLRIVERYNFKVVEEKWQKFWEENKIFKTKLDKNKKKFYCLRNVSLSIRKNSYGTCKKLYHWRCFI